MHVLMCALTGARGFNLHVSVFGVCVCVCDFEGGGVRHERKWIHGSVHLCSKYMYT